MKDKYEKSAVNLDFDEKLHLLSLKNQYTSYGANGKLPEIIMYDGPCGVRRSTSEDNSDGSVHCYPSPHAVANTWDPHIAYMVGEAIASDFIDNGIDFNLAPGVNIKRTPLCGRNFEYFSEDPYLAGICGAEYIKGCQSRGVGTSVKHFCCNNREWDRLFQSSEVDLRTMREIYTKAFEYIVKEANPWTVMCSYNPINGINCAENKFILDTILRQKLGYQGVIISDWGAVHDPVLALKATLDIVCAIAPVDIEELKKGLREGVINEDDVNAAVDRILALAERVKNARKNRVALPKEKRAEIALRAAESGIVLLKNEGGVLPIKGGSVALIGEYCELPLYTGGGSAGTILTEPLKGLGAAMRENLPESEIKYKWVVTSSSCTDPTAGVRTVGLRCGMELAYDSDYTVLVVGNNCVVETESYDRLEIRLDPRHEKAILSLAEMTDKLIVVIEAGSAVDTSPWIDKVAAVVFAGFGGESVNQAIANVLTGKVNPSGRLSETFPMCLEDTPTQREMGSPYAERYAEGVLVGYRYYTTKKIPVMFPFGYGLSYSSFSYSDFSVENLGGCKYRVSVTVKNDSDVDGHDTVQLYVKNVDMCVERPTVELRRFEKVFIPAGESRKVEFITDKDCFEYFNVCYDAWHVDAGRYELCINRDANTTVFCEKIRIENGDLQ